MFTLTAVPDAKFPVPGIHLTSVTATQEKKKKKTGKVAHTNSQGNLLYFLPRSSQRGGRGRGELCDPPLLYHHHHHLTGMCGVGVYVCGYCAHVDSWCLCLHQKNGGGFWEVRMTTGAELPLLKSFLLLQSNLPFISDPFCSKTSDGLWLRGQQWFPPSSLKNIKGPTLYKIYTTNVFLINKMCL